MSQDSEEFVVAGNGGLFLAPVGTALPTNESTALNAAFHDCGFSTEDGVTFGVGLDFEEIMSWQSRDATRRLHTGREFTTQIELQQWNEGNLAAAFGGGTVSEVSSGHYRFDFLGDDDNVEEFAAIVKWVDGAKDYLLVMPRATANDGGEVNLNRTSAGTLPVSLKALKPDGGLKVAYILTNDPAFATGS